MLLRIAKRAIIPLLLLMGLPTLALCQQTGQLPRSDQVMRFSVGEVNVNVMVTDSHGHFVSGLRRSDFRVFDNGVEQPITSFSPNEEPSHVLVLIESGAEDYLLAKVGRSLFADAAEFVKGIYSFDRVAIATYSDRAYLVWDFASNGPSVQVALKQLNTGLLHGASGSSGLVLSSSLAAALYWLRNVQGKKAVVLVSTGLDTSSPQERQFIENELSTSDIPVLAVSAFGDFRRLPPRRKLSADAREEQAFVKEGMVESDEWLRRLATASAGHAYFPSNTKEFQDAYARITQLIRGEYGIGFAPSLLDGKTHSITVRVKHPWYRSYRLDNRRGYIAGSSAQN
ncbi:MAG TPA: VWA domain-containing protein [Candidatus Acidoferrales bacterium]|nr:VWA domain-containing protein [Candidatus Acidoferrales bacterium]